MIWDWRTLLIISLSFLGGWGGVALGVDQRISSVWSSLSVDDVRPPESDFVKVEHNDSVFWVARTETTVGECKLCVAAGACPDILVNSRGEDYPMTGVNWSDTNAYIRWYSRRTGLLARLPTRQEWLLFSAEHAPVQRPKIFDDPRLSWAANYDIDAGPPTSVVEPSGFFGSNALGISDVRGNVWEWTESCQLPPRSESDSHGICFTGRYAMGDHTAILVEGVRNPAKAGCGGGLPPANVGFRVVVNTR